MKRTIAVLVLVATLVAVVAGVTLAQTPPGNQPTAPATDTCPCGLESVGGMGGGMRGGVPEWAGADDVVTKLLGLTAEQLQAERQAGKSLVEIAAAAKGMSETALIQAILDDHNADLAQLVKDGKLTQEQADAMLTHMEAQVKVMVNRTGVGPMWGEGQQPGRGGMMGRPGGTEMRGGGMRGNMLGGRQG